MIGFGRHIISALGVFLTALRAKLMHKFGGTINKLCKTWSFRGLVLTVFALCAMPVAVAQVTTYEEDFVAGVPNNPGDSQVDNWEAFRDSLTATYSRLDVGGSQGPGASCSDPAAIAAITSALNTDTPASVACEGRSWNIGVCVGDIELSVDSPICTCQTASVFTLRPDVDAAGAAWGGIGATCGVNGNVDQTLRVSAEEFGGPTDVDISLTLSPASTSPTIGANTLIDINLLNVGPADASGVLVDFALPSGLTFVSDDAGGDYDPATGVWTVGAIAQGESPRLRMVVNVATTGSYALTAEVSATNENDNDSTPGNNATNPNEDDSDSVTLTPSPPPPALFCLGRPITPLVFANPVAESPGANLTTPQVNDVFRFVGVSPGNDALVRVAGFNNGATLAGIDNDADGGGAPIGIPDNFQPTLVGPAGDVSVDFEITFVATGTNTAGTLDFAGSAIDVDGNGATLREYIEVSNNIVEFALNGVSPPDPATRLVTQANTPPDAGASAPSAANRVRFEASTDDTAAGIDPNEPRNIAAAFFTDVSVFEYRIGKLGPATAGRLNSLAFNCPNIDPGTTTGGTLVEEDFGDAPFDADPAITPNYGNPIHVIAAGIQLGATNTAETGPGNSATASSDAGDDGVTLPASFQGLVPVTFNVDARGAGGFLEVFVDWNNDGDFEDAGEQPIVDLQDTDGNDATPIQVTITPPGNTVTATSFARFRWSTAQGVGIQDPAGDGEVEDYQITLIAAEPADLSLALTPSTASPTFGDDVSLTLTVTNDGPQQTDGITVSYQLPDGLIFVSDNGGGAYDPATGILTLPAALAATESFTLIITAEVAPTGSYVNTAEIETATRPDPDSIPGNGDAAEDDFDTVTLFPAAAPTSCGIPETGIPSAFAGQIAWVDLPANFSVGIGGSSSFDTNLPDGRIVTLTVSVDATSPRGLESIPLGSGGNRPLPVLFGPEVNTVNAFINAAPNGESVIFTITSASALDFVVADGERNTATTESWRVETDGGVWEAIDSINTSAYTLTGNETQTIEVSGTSGTAVGTPVLTSRDASTLDVTLTGRTATAGLSGLALGIFLPDTGDAPAAYPIAAHDKDQFNPACNAFGSDNIFIGALAPDGDDALAIASDDADGDDTTNVDDEGGLTLPDLATGVAADFNIPVSGGLFQAWIDWNRDNDFDDTVGGISEQIAADLAPTNGQLSFSVTPPPGIASGNLVVRLRAATAAGLGPTGFADDGEVEDHLLVFVGGDADIVGEKVVEVFDPDGDGLFAVPGNDVTYTINVSNIGAVDAGENSVVLIDNLPAEITFFNGDADGPGAGTDPVNFTEIEPTGLDPFVFVNDVGFSNAATAPGDFAACDYTPIAGYDPAVTFICFNPKGVFLTGDPAPSFSVSFRARIR